MQKKTSFCHLFANEGVKSRDIDPKSWAGMMESAN